MFAETAFEWLIGVLAVLTGFGVLCIVVVALDDAGIIDDWRARWRAWRNPVAALRAEDRNRLAQDQASSPESHERAEALLQRLVPNTNPTYTYVDGGATGHQYRINRWSMFYSIYNLTTGESLCAVPFNRWSLPCADIALAQALLLACPETERHFLSLANRMRF